VGHDREVNQLLETVKIYSDHPAMKHQLTSYAELLRNGGTPEEKQLAEEITEEFNITTEDIDQIPPFWIKANLKRMD